MLAAGGASAAPRVDTLATGRMAYRILIDGKPHGEQAIAITRTAADRSTLSMEARSFGQRWTVVGDGAFRPISARLQMPTRAGAYAMTLNYGPNTVTGAHGTVATEVSDPLPPGVVDQRVDWAYVAAARLPRGARLSFIVYDPVTKVSRAEAHGLGRRWVDVGGKRTRVNSTAYRIVKASGTEDYVVHVAAAGPAVMVREDMPGGLRIDLIAFKATSR